MTILDRVPVIIGPSEMLASLRLDPGRGGLDSLDDLISLAQDLIHSHGVFDCAPVGARGKKTVEVGSVEFMSILLTGHLRGVQTVFPYIITIGPELELAAAAQGDLLKQYYLEEIANYALEQAFDWLVAHLEQRYGVGPLSNLSPGSLEDWPITEQAKLFSIFGDTESLVGVRLTDSMLMVPRKSISGILFPSEEGFVACELCEREHCQGRKAPFIGVNT